MPSLRANPRQIACRRRQFSLARLLLFVTFAALVCSAYRVVPREYYFTFSLFAAPSLALLYGLFVHKKREVCGVLGAGTAGFLIAIAAWAMMSAHLGYESAPRYSTAMFVFFVGVGLLGYAVFCFRRGDLSDLANAGWFAPHNATAPTADHAELP